MDNDKLAWIIILTILVTAIIVGGGIYVWQNSSYLEEKTAWLSKTEQWKNQVNILQNKLSEVAAPSQFPEALSALGQGVLRHENSEFKFTLELPAFWANYKTSTYKNNNLTTLCYYFQASSPVCIMQIYVYTPYEWSTLQKQPHYIAENNSYVFAYDTPTDCNELSDFQCARIGEVSEILKTFKLPIDPIKDITNNQ